MCPSSPRIPRPASRAPSRNFALPILAAVALAGCASRSEHAASDPRVTPPQQYAAAAVRPQPELEDDGLPAQRPPLLRSQRLPDDPTEPFSPNYGNPPPSRANAIPAQRAAGSTPALQPAVPVVRVSAFDLPDDLPPDFAERLIVTQGLR